MFQIQLEITPAPVPMHLRHSSGNRNCCARCSRCSTVALLHLAHRDALLLQLFIVFSQCLLLQQQQQQQQQQCSW
jgi:hypothetical protein